MNIILYYIIYFWMYLHALLPLSLLYILSDIFYFIVYKIFKYRLKVVRDNLSSSFPEKNSVDLRILEKRFYHHLCDYFVETMKLLHISDKEMQQRMIFENVGLVKDAIQNGNSAIMFLGHYCNWEWVTSLNLSFKDTDCLLGQIYKPLRNKAVDDLFLKIRSRFGSFGIPKNDTFRTIIKLRREGKQTLIGFMADQTPRSESIHYWTNFLNHDTPVFTGVERIAKQTNFSVLYLDIEKIKRGHYRAMFKVVTDRPKETPENAITETYIRLMEKTILRDPAYWLWTHKRWKRTRQEIEELHKK